MVIGVVGLVGCSFSPAGDDTAGDNTPDASPHPPARRCSASPDPALVLCLDFEDQPLADVAVDGSGRLHDAAASRVGVGARGGEQAAMLSADSSLHVAETPDLDLAQLTVAMWIQPEAAPPSGKVWWLLDNADQYTMQYEDEHQIRCGVRGETVDGDRAVAPRSGWHHVACRYDGTELRVYVDGDVVDCEQVTGAAATGGSTGTAIGSRVLSLANGVQVRDRFLGGIDNVAVYGRALEEDRICAAAGRPPGSCSTRCPTGGGGGGGNDRGPRRGW
ncbi:MAG: LamG domain-containing protein [Kofleriaceae bacterium]